MIHHKLLRSVYHPDFWVIHTTVGYKCHDIGGFSGSQTIMAKIHYKAYFPLCHMEPGEGEHAYGYAPLTLRRKKKVNVCCAKPTLSDVFHSLYFIHSVSNQELLCNIGSWQNRTFLNNVTNSNQLPIYVHPRELEKAKVNMCTAKPTLMDVFHSTNFLKVNWYYSWKKGHFSITWPTQTKCQSITFKIHCTGRFPLMRIRKSKSICVVQNPLWGMFDFKNYRLVFGLSWSRDWERSYFIYFKYYKVASDWRQNEIC